MKQIGLLFALSIIAIVAFAQTAADFQKLKWLAGTWKKVNSKPQGDCFRQWKIHRFFI